MSDLADFPFAAEVLAMSGQCHLAGQEYARAAELFRELGRKYGKHDLADDAAALLVEALYLSGEHRQAVKAAGKFGRGLAPERTGRAGRLLLRVGRHGGWASGLLRLSSSPDC